MSTTTVRGFVGGMAQRSNPAFAGAAVAVPLLALAYALTVAPEVHHLYVHVMAGVVWTGVDLYMGLVLGPVLGGLSISERANVFRRFTPKMTFLMPSLAIVTIFGGVTLAERIGKFPHAEPWIAIMSTAITLPALVLVGYQLRALTDRRLLAVLAVAVVGHGVWLFQTLPEFAMTSQEILVALVLVVALSLVGFGVILPGEIRIYREMLQPDPDEQLIGDIGMRNAKLGGLQGLMQLAVIAVMVYVRWPGTW